MPDNEDKALQAIISGLEDHGGKYGKLARALGVDSTHLYIAWPANGGQRGRVSPTLRRALERSGRIPRPYYGTKLTARLEDTQDRAEEALALRRREALHRLAGRAGKSWSQYCRDLADQMIANGILEEE